jgi:hypothetical protein
MTMETTQNTVGAMADPMDTTPRGATPHSDPW